MKDRLTTLRITGRNTDTITTEKGAEDDIP